MIGPSLLARFGLLAFQVAATLVFMSSLVVRAVREARRCPVGALYLPALVLGSTAAHRNRRRRLLAKSDAYRTWPDADLRADPACTPPAHPPVRQAARLLAEADAAAPAPAPAAAAPAPAPASDAITVGKSAMLIPDSQDDSPSCPLS